MRTLIILLAIGAAHGCDDSTPQPGEPGGACLLGAEPCAGELTCVDGICAEAPDAPETARFEVQINFPEETVLADGETRVGFDIQVFVTPPGGERRAYEEDDGGFFLTPIPVEAGRIEPGRPALLQGLGLVEFVPCDRRTAFNCPEAAVIRFALDAAPSEAVAETPRFLLLDPTPPSVDAGVDEGG